MARLVDDHDVRVVEGRRGAGLLLEPREELGVFRILFAKDLQRDFPVQTRVAGSVYLSHPSAAERSENPVGTESGSRRQDHRALTLRDVSFRVVRAETPRDFAAAIINAGTGPTPFLVTAKVTGTLDPYRDPDCGCEVTTTFSGEVHGDRVGGTFTSSRTAGRVFGTWKATRKR